MYLQLSISLLASMVTELDLVSANALKTAQCQWNDGPQSAQSKGQNSPGVSSRVTDSALQLQNQNGISSGLLGAVSCLIWGRAGLVAITTDLKA
jgi:hypothetical protein